MSTWQVIIKNNSGITQIVEDLGISIATATQITFSDQFTYDEIAGSDDLRALVLAGTLVVNDSVGDLSAANGVNWLSLENIKDVRDNHYTKTEMQSSGQAQLHWDNITNAPTFGDTTWTEPVDYIVDTITTSASIPGAGSVVNAYYVNTSDDTYYKWSGSAWVSAGPVLDGDRVINEADADDPIYEYTSSGDSWTDLGTPADNTAVIVNDDGDGKPAQYVYDTITLWIKIGDIDFTGHFNGGASKHDASEIDVEGTYTYVTSGGNVENAISDIDTQLGTNATAASTAQSAIDTHLNGGANKHDASEIDVEGTYTYITSGGNVENALSDIDTALGSVIHNTLDGAYDQDGAGLGRIIIVDAGAVKLDASSDFYAPLELSTQSASPTAGLATGQLSNIGGILCMYDSVRAKWLSVQRYFLTFGRKGNTKDQYLNFAGGTLPSNNSGYRLMRNATIIGMTAQLNASGTCTFNVRKDDVLTNITALSVSAAIGNQVTTTNIDVAASSYLQSYLGAASSVADPMFMVEIAWNLT
jgi:hypothetical protein